MMEKTVGNLWRSGVVVDVAKRMPGQPESLLSHRRSLGRRVIVYEIWRIEAATDESLEAGLHGYVALKVLRLNYFVLSHSNIYSWTVMTLSASAVTTARRHDQLSTETASTHPQHRSPFSHTSPPLLLSITTKLTVFTATPPNRTTITNTSTQHSQCLPAPPPSSSSSSLPPPSPSLSSARS